MWKRITMLCRGTEIIEVKYQDGTKKRRGAKKAPSAPGRFLVILIDSSIIILFGRFLVKLKSAGTILNHVLIVLGAF